MPVGVGVLLTAIVTDSACAVVMLDKDGVTVTVGVAFATVTFDEVPDALL
jgi:hypothetical protein